MIGTVDAVVDDTIGRMRDAGRNVAAAEAELAVARSNRATGAYKIAYDHYRSAYRFAVKSF